MVIAPSEHIAGVVQKPCCRSQLCFAFAERKFFQYIVGSVRDNIRMPEAMFGVADDLKILICHFNIKPCFFIIVQGAEVRSQINLPLKQALLRQCMPCRTLPSHFPQSSKLLWLCR